jgi:hypothetical protein
MPFEKVKEELQFFLDQKVVQVKFIDRTFNCIKEHAMKIWQYLHENDNGITNFHFEISADLLDDAMIDFLMTVREGLFQFEIGVQTTNEETLKAIHRKMDFDKLSQNVLRLKKAQNIHIHLDLIAGLPYEDYTSFEKTFNEVYRLEPEQLQLGFLKVLKGSLMWEEAEKYDIRYRDYSPYEVIQSKDLDFNEMITLKRLEEVLEIYYNSGNYTHVLHYIQSFFESSFKLYEQLAAFLKSHDYFGKNHSKNTLCAAIKEFSSQILGCKEEIINELMIYDLYLQEKLKKLPDFLEKPQKMREAIIDFYRNEDNIHEYLPSLEGHTSKQISRIAHLEVFEYDIMGYIQSGYTKINKKQTAILFDYNHRDKMQHQAKVNQVLLNEVFPRE